MLKQTVVHWVEEELLGMWEDVFLGVLKRVMTEIGGEALKEAKFCEKCGLVLVKNGRERLTIILKNGKKYHSLMPA